MTTSKGYDALNRLTAMGSRTGVAPVSISAYAYTSARGQAKGAHARAIASRDGDELALDSKPVSNGALAHGVRCGAGQPDTMKRPLVISAFSCVPVP
jgi:hypothetical protein